MFESGNEKQEREYLVASFLIAGRSSNAAQERHRKCRYHLTMMHPSSKKYCTFVQTPRERELKKKRFIHFGQGKVDRAPMRTESLSKKDQNSD